MPSKSSRSPFLLLSFFLAYSILCLIEPVKSSCPSDSRSSSSSPCDLYICYESCQDQGFPAHEPIYATASEALKSANESSNVRLFFASPGSYLDPLYLEPSISKITFARFSSDITVPSTLGDDERPQVGKINLLPSHRSSLSISFIGIHLSTQAKDTSSTHECLDVSGGMQLDVLVKDSKVTCGLTMQSLSPGSKFTIIDNSHFACLNNCPTLDIMAVHSSIYILNSKMDHFMRIRVSQGSSFQLLSGTHLGPLSLGTDLNSTLIISNCQFNGSLHITSDWNGDATRDPSEEMIQITGNTFVLGLDLTGLTFGATISKNKFLGIPRSDYVRPNQNLYIAAECRSKVLVMENFFSCGTFFIGMPSARQEHNLCPGFNTPYKDTIIRHNCFPLPASTKPFFADIMPTSVLPAIAVIDPTNSIGIYASQQESDSKNEQGIKREDPLSSGSAMTNEESQVEIGNLENLPYRSRNYKGYPSTKSLLAMVIDASENWWGDSSGPWLCCNPQGKGGYSTPLVRSDRWCLDEWCTQVSNKEMSTNSVSEDVCLTSCCPQVMTTPQKSILIAMNVIGNVVLLVTAVVVIIWHKRHFSALACQKTSKSSIFDRVVSLMYVALGASSMGAMLILATSGLLLYINNQTLVTPRQERLQVDAAFVLVLFIFIAVLQLDLNGLMFIALLLRERFPKFLHFLSGKNYIVNLLYLTFITTISMFWLPSLLGANFTWAHLSFLESSGSTVLTSASRLSPLIYLAALPCALMTLCVMVPNQTLNNLLYFYEYITITDALEAALLKELADSPQVSKRAKLLRILALIALPFATTLFGMHIYLLYAAIKTQNNANKGLGGTSQSSPQYSPTASPYLFNQLLSLDSTLGNLFSSSWLSSSSSLGYSQGLYDPKTISSLITPPTNASSVTISWKKTWFLPLIDTPGRWINSLATSTLGVIATLFTIFGTFYYQRIYLFTICSTALLLAALGPLENAMFEVAVVISAGDATRLLFLRGSHLAFCVLTTIAFIVLIVFTWKLRNMVIEQLPLMAVSNLNSHLDALWQSTSPTMDKRRFTQIINESETDDDYVDEASSMVKLHGTDQALISNFNSGSSVFSVPSESSEYDSLLSSSTDNES